LPLKLPEQNVRDYAHGLAFKLACEQMAGIADIKEQCLKSGAQYITQEKAILIDYLGQKYRISLPGCGVSLTDSGEAVPVRDRILLLHYFTRARGTNFSGKVITYKDLPEGINYFPVFAKRAIKPLVDCFGKQPHRLLQAAEKLGGRKTGIGDTSVTINAFSRVPVTIVLWHGDKEFAPEGSLMFDGSISDYLSNDDIHALCEDIAWRLVGLAKTGGD
jgi:hypothetical protein